MIKLIATDLDGTLFYPKRRLTGMIKENKKFLKSFLNSGKDVLIASGRSTGMLSKLEKTLNHKLYFIGCNGSFIIDKNTKEISNRRPLNRQMMAKLFLTMRDRYSIFCWFALDTSPNLYYHFDEKIPKYISLGFKLGNFFNNFYREKVVSGKENLLNRLQCEDTFKLMPIFSFGKSSQVKTERTYLAIKDIFQDELEIALADGALEITSKGVNKGTGLKLFCKKYGIKEDEIIVIGDHHNDISMFRSFPHSFCMSHSSDDVKKYANHIVDYLYQIQDYLKDESSLKNDIIKYPYKKDEIDI